MSIEFRIVMFIVASLLSAGVLRSAAAAGDDDARPIGWHIDAGAYRPAPGGQTTPLPEKTYYAIGESADSWRERISIFTLPAREGALASSYFGSAVAKLESPCADSSGIEILNDPDNAVSYVTCSAKNSGGKFWAAMVRVLTDDAHAYVFAAEYRPESAPVAIHEVDKAMMYRWVDTLGTFNRCTDWTVAGCWPELSAATLHSELPLGPEEAAAVALAERRAAAMYHHDQIAWHGTDYAMAKKLFDRRHSRGYVTTTRDGGGGDIWFLLDRGRNAAVRVNVDAQHDATGHERVRKLPDDIVLREKALRTGKTKDISLCTELANTILIPDDDGWLVYVISASKQHGLVYVGGHTRVRVTSDGKRVVDLEPSANTCLAFDLTQISAEARERDAGASGNDALENGTPMASHVRGATPTEFHVFQSLTFKTPMLINTRDAFWRVEGGRIRKIAQRNLSPNADLEK